MKTIKIIDLLNMISKGEEVPNKIKYLSYEYEFNKEDKEYQRDYKGYNYGLGEDRRLDIMLDDEVEIIKEEKELHANDIEFNINNDKKDCIITLDENDLGIDKLHLDNCYFYKENDKWYVKKYDFKSFKLEEEHKIPEKLDIVLLDQSDNWTRKYNKNLKDFESAHIELNPYVIDVIRQNTLEFQSKINEILDYLEEIEQKRKNK